jgi:hypothetical protein
MQLTITDFDLKIRFQIYHYFAEQCRAPSFQELAHLLNVTEEAVSHSFHNLHNGHMIFLEPGTNTIRMAFPFSAVPTQFKVTVGQKAWWANCAWDSLGIPAALKTDADIEAAYPDSQEIVTLPVRNGAVEGKNHVVYFPLPFHQWYNDLIFT